MLLLLASALAALPAAAPQDCTFTASPSLPSGNPTARSMAAGTDTLFVGYSYVQNLRGRVKVLHLSPDGEITPDGWIDHPTVTPPSSYQGFGRTIVAEGDRMVVTCPNDNYVLGVSGGAYAYSRSPAGDWVYESPVLAPWGISPAKFGNSAAMDGDWLFIGEHSIAEQTAIPGRVHVYQRSGMTWLQTQVINGTRPGFSYSLDAEGGRLLVGSFSGTGANGGAFVFEEVSGFWSQTASLPPLPNGGGEQNFGRDVAIEGALAVVSADGYQDGLNRRGAAAVFQQNSSGHWSLAQQLQSLPGTTGSSQDNYGRLVDLSDGMIAIGARTPGVSASAIAYGIEVWGAVCGVWQRARIYGAPAGGLPQSSITDAIVFSGSRVIAAYPTLLVSREMHCTLGGAECAPNMQNETRLSAALRALGSLTISDDDFWLRVESLPVSSAGLMLLSDTLQPTPFQGCNAELCLGGTIARGSSSPLVASAQGQVTYTLDLQGLPAVLGGGPVQAGQTWYFQYWYRNPSTTKPVGLSNAVGVTFE